MMRDFNSEQDTNEMCLLSFPLHYSILQLTCPHNTIDYTLDTLEQIKLTINFWNLTLKIFFWVNNLTLKLSVVNTHTHQLKGKPGQAH